MQSHAPRRLLGGLLVPALLALATTGCLAREPDRLESERVDVPVNEPTELTIEHGASAMFADAGHAADVRCESWPDGKPGERAELVPHYLDIQTPVPVTRDGVEYHTVGRFPSDPGPVVVECTGPGAAELYAVLTRPPG